MKVLFLSSWYIGDKGKGDVNFVYDQIETISKKVDAYYFEYQFNGILKWLILKLKGKEIVEITRLWDNSNVKAYMVNLPRFSTRITRRSLYREIEIHSKLFSKYILKILGKPDVIHIHTILPSGIMGTRLKEILDTKLVIHEHSGPFDMHMDTSEKKYNVKEILYKADGLIVVSDFLKENITKEFRGLNKKVFVVPNLVRTDIFKVDYLKSRDVFTIVTIINEQPIKGLSILFEVAKILKNRYNLTYKWKLIGLDRNNSSLIKKIKKRNIEFNFEILGKMSKEEIFNVFQNCNIYVCTSFEETFGLAPAEAIASGVPVVSTKCGGPEMYMNKNTGLWALVGDPNDIADKIILLGSTLNQYNPELMHNWIKSNYSPQEYSENIQSVYDQI